MGRLPHQLFLGKFSLQGILYGNPGIRRSRHPHGLIHIGSSGKGIPDGAAQTGGRSAEGLDLRGMVVGLILEIYQPFLCLSVDFHRHHNAAGVNLFRFLLILQFSFLFQLFHRHQRQIHQADKFILPSLVHILPVRQIAAVGVLHGFLVISLIKGNILKLCGKRGMTAVVRPVGIQHPDLGHAGIPFFLIREIVLYMEEIPERHGQIQRIVQLPQLLAVHP